jgi:hypothetical protein
MSDYRQREAAAKTAHDQVAQRELDEAEAIKNRTKHPDPNSRGPNTPLQPSATGRDARDVQAENEAAAAAVQRAVTQAPILNQGYGAERRSKQVPYDGPNKRH